MKRPSPNGTFSLPLVGRVGVGGTALALCLLMAMPAFAEITITRDNWGIAHIHAPTDAQAVFGMIYAQAEDDFNRIETNYLTALGRTAEAEGEGALAQDLRARLYSDPADLKARYGKSPAWLQTLMTAWAAGLNAYLASHPDTHPKVLKHFEPWMALAFSEGSIGGDIEDIALPGLAAFYNLKKYAALNTNPFREPTGSNGIAIAPANTRDRHALLLINPHTSFYFRSEMQVTSDEGLNAYGAATWGQFFLYQGFNSHLGWMHTSTTADAVDQFRETIVRKDGALFTKSGSELRPIATRKITLSYRTSTGQATRDFKAFITTHGPVVAKTPDGHWIAEAMMFKPVEALAQSFSLTKAQNYAGFIKAMQWQANSSNNTVYADADGTIAYLHPQFIPRRDPQFDYAKPVDGADPRTAWQGIHTLEELPHVQNPATAWIQNTNNGPWSVCGTASPAAKDFPRYMDGEGENMRGLHAIDVIQGRKNFTLESLVAAAYDSRQPGFARLIPKLLADYEQLPKSAAERASLAEQIALLGTWDDRWSANSVQTSLAVYWGEALWHAAGLQPHSGSLTDYATVLTRTTPSQRLAALTTASAKLTADFGTWRTPWGSINRVQRRTADIAQAYSDTTPSLPVPYTSGQWGSLAAISGPTQPGVHKRYGDDGNSFVAAIEFSNPPRAVAISAGGESGDPASPHFTDQFARFTTGQLRPVYFTPSDLAAHTERSEHLQGG